LVGCPTIVKTEFTNGLVRWAELQCTPGLCGQHGSYSQVRWSQCWQV